MDVEWSDRVPSERRGTPAIPAQYSLVTQLLKLPLDAEGGADEDQVEIGYGTLEPYYVNASLFEMVAECSDNSTHNKCFKLFDADVL